MYLFAISLCISFLLTWNLFLLPFNFTHAQPSPFSFAEDTLKSLRLQVLKSRDDSSRISANKEFLDRLEKYLKKENALSYPFDSLPNIGRLYPPDKSFRLFCWNLPVEDGTYLYYCLIQCFDTKKKKMIVMRLTDRAGDDIITPENKSLGKDKWFGALYYEMVPVKIKKKTFYTLLGWRGCNRMITQKVIDVLSFSGNWEPQFGESVFIAEKNKKKRIVFSYSAQSAMSLKYYERQKQIIFDHLSPSMPNLKDQYQYYGPDFTYDAFILENGKWNYKANIDARNASDSPIYNPE